MHWQFAGDLIVCQITEPLQPGPAESTVDFDEPPAWRMFGAGLVGVAAISVGSRTPDMLETLFPRHGAHRAALSFDDANAHA